MKSILITGANGYLGARLSEMFSMNGYKVTGLCFPSVPENLTWIDSFKELLTGDLREEQTIEVLLKKDFDIIIHLVSLDQHQSENNPNFISAINVLPIWNLLDKYSKKDRLVKFIYFSTIQVYGSVTNKEITEEYRPSPRNNYGLTHYMSENICNYYNNKPNIISINIRLSNSYGSPVLFDSNCWNLVINDFCKTAFNEKKIKLLSDGSPQRDFIHSSDVYNAVELLVKKHQKELDNNTYNLSSGKTFTILEIAHIVKNVFEDRYNTELKIMLPDNSISENPDKFLNKQKCFVSNSKLKKLGFIVKTDLITGINEIFDYLEQNPKA